MFNQSALRYFLPECTAASGLHEDVTPSSRVDSREKGLMVVMFCTDLPVKAVKEIMLDFHNS